MPTYAPATKEEFLLKIEDEIKQINGYNVFLINNRKDDPNYLNQFENWILENPNYLNYIPVIKQSLNFNTYYFIFSRMTDKGTSGKKFIGIHTLENGFIFLGIRVYCPYTALYFPIAYIIYLNEKYELACYIPKKGNPHYIPHQQPYQNSAIHWQHAKENYPEFYPDTDKFHKAVKVLQNMMVENDEQEGSIAIVSNLLNVCLQQKTLDKLLNELYFKPHCDYDAMLEEIQKQFG